MKGMKVMKTMVKVAAVIKKPAAGIEKGSTVSKFNKELDDIDAGLMRKEQQAETMAKKGCLSWLRSRVVTAMVHFRRRPLLSTMPH